jgi:hypothetical protein
MEDNKASRKNTYFNGTLPCLKLKFLIIHGNGIEWEYSKNDNVPTILL